MLLSFTLLLHTLFFLLYTLVLFFHCGLLFESEEWCLLWAAVALLSLTGICPCVKRTFVLAPHFEVTAFICLLLSTHFQNFFFTCVTFPHLIFHTVSPVVHCPLCSDSLLSRLLQGHTGYALLLTD